MKKTLFVVATLLVSWSHAELIEVSNSASGWIRDSDGGKNLNGNYVTGGVGSWIMRSVFVFDVSGFTNATSATLQLSTYSISEAGTFSLYDVSSAINSNGLVSGGTDVYNDLGTGLIYGDISLTTSQADQLISITLSANALNDINSAGGLWAVGGSYASSGNVFGASEITKIIN